MNSFGKNMADLREIYDCSLYEMEIFTGITKSVLSRYERGIIIPTIYKAKIIADFLCVNIDEMLNGNYDVENSFNKYMLLREKRLNDNKK